MIFVYPQKTSCQHFTETEKLDFFSFPACEFVQTLGQMADLLFKNSNDVFAYSREYTERLLLLIKDMKTKLYIYI